MPTSERFNNKRRLVVKIWPEVWIQSGSTIHRSVKQATHQIQPTKCNDRAVITDEIRDTTHYVYLHRWEHLTHSGYFRWFPPLQHPRASTNSKFSRRRDASHLVRHPTFYQRGFKANKHTIALTFFSFYSPREKNFAREFVKWTVSTIFRTFLLNAIRGIFLVFNETMRRGVKWGWSRTIMGSSWTTATRKWRSPVWGGRGPTRIAWSRIFWSTFTGIEVRLKLENSWIWWNLRIFLIY